MAQLNRYPEAIIPATATAARLGASDAYAVAVGELVFTSDTLQLYAASGLSAGNFVRIPTTDSLGAIYFKTATALTNTLSTVQTNGHNSSGTPAAGFGIRDLYMLKSATVTDRNAAAVDVFWTDPTDATRKAAVAISAADASGFREGVRVGTDGSQALLAFYAATPVAKQAVTGSRSSNAALANLLTALAALGLITDSTS